MPTRDPAVPCEYPDCYKRVTFFIVIERGPGSIKRYVCSTHGERGQQFTQQLGGLAYRLFPIALPRDPDGSDDPGAS